MTDEIGSAPKGTSAGTGNASLGTEEDELAPLTEIQQQTLRRTQLLKLKAEAELERLQKPQPPDAAQKKDDSSPGKGNPQDPAAAQPKPIDPKMIKAGFQKAIDLAPQAALHMERAVKSLKQKDPKAAYPPASLARQILEEIQKAQPAKNSRTRKRKMRIRRSRINRKTNSKKRNSRRKTSNRTTARRKIKRRRTKKRKSSRRKTRNRRSKNSQTSRTNRNRIRSGRNRRFPAIGSKRHYGESANGSKKSANATA